MGNPCLKVIDNFDDEINNLNTNNINNFIEDFPILEVDQVIKNNAYEFERQILGLSGFKLDDEIYSEDIPIEFYGKNYIHTIKVINKNKNNSNNKKDMVLLHGYHTSSANFVKLFKYFNKEYNIYAIDLIGMGLSSRPQITFKESKEYINFFVDSIEAFRKSLNFKKFHLVGHSLGGYISASYAIKYPSFLSKVTLLSPAGITNKSNGGKISKNQSIVNRLGFTLLTPFISMNITLQDVFKTILKPIIKKGLRERFFITKEENELYSLLTEQILLYPKDLDYVVVHFFQPPIPCARFPLEDELFEKINNINFDIFFGSEDWMDTDGSIRLCERDRNRRFRIFWIQNGKHSFFVENADVLGELMSSRIEEENKRDFNFIKY